MVAMLFSAAALLARPAGANLVVQLGGAEKAGDKVSRKIKTTVGQKIHFQVAQVNQYGVPLVALCRLPVLNVKAQGILLPGKLEARWLTAVCVREGTYHVTALMAYQDPYTGRVKEVADTCLVVCEKPKSEGGSLEVPPFDAAGWEPLSTDSTGPQGGEEEGGLVVLDPPTGSPTSTDILQQGGGQQGAGQQSGAGRQQSGGQQSGVGQQQTGLGGGQQHHGSDGKKEKSAKQQGGKKEDSKNKKKKDRDDD